MRLHDLLSLPNRLETPNWKATADGGIVHGGTHIPIADCYLRNAGARVTRPFKDNIVGQPRDIHSYDDPRYLAFLRELTAALNEALPFSADSEGFISPEAAPSTFDDVRSVCALPMTPRGFLIGNTAHRREHFGLPHDIRNARHLEILNALLEDKFSRYCLTGIPVASGPTGGAPFNATDNAFKIPHAMLSVNNEDVVCKLYVDNKMDELFRRFKIINVAQTGGRLQQEPPSKVRNFVPTQGALGYDFDIAAYVANKDAGIADFARQRARLVAAVPTPQNMLLAKYLKPYDLTYKTTRAFGMVHRGNAHVAAKFNHMYGVAHGRSTLFYDVGQYDNTKPRCVTAAVARKLAEISEDFAAFYMMTFSMPAITQRSASEFDRGEPAAQLTGNPFDLDACARHLYCFQSGRKDTSHDSYFEMDFNSLILHDEATDRRLSVEQLISLSRHDHLFRGNPYDVPSEYWYEMISYGDDHSITGNAKINAVKADPEFIKEHSYYNLTAEPISKSGGSLIRRDASGVFTASYNPCTYFRKEFAPEKDYRNPTVKNRAAGSAYRLEIMRDDPGMHRALEICDRLHEKYFGFKWTHYVHASADAVSGDVSELIDIDPIDNYWRLENAEIDAFHIIGGIPLSDLHYKYTLIGDEVSKEELAQERRAIERAINYYHGV